MDFRHLRAFLVIAEEMNLTRAAKRLHLAQPHLTRVLQQLEEDVGTPLFDRSNKRHLLLTPAGQTFLSKMKPLLEQFDAAVQETQRVAEGRGKQLVVGYSPAAMFSGIFPETMQVYEYSYPGLLVVRDLSTQSYKRQIKALREHHLDAIFVLRPLDEPGIAHECIGKIPMVAALPHTHRLAHLSAISSTDLADEGWICPPRQIYPRIFDEVVSLCQQTGFTPRFARVLPQAQAVVSLVAAGVGVAVLSGWVALGTQQRGAVYRPLPDVSYQSELHVLWREEDRSPLLQTFLQIVRVVSKKLDQTWSLSAQAARSVE